MVRCPACRARLNGQTQCGRCGSNLSLPLQAEAEAKQWTQCAVRHFSEGAFDAADAALKRALVLHQTPLALSLRPFFAQRGTVRPVSTAKPGSVFLKRIDEAQPQLNEPHPGSPAVAETGQRFGWRLLRALTGGEPLQRNPLRSEDESKRKPSPSAPKGLIVWLADACLSRPAAGKLALQAETMVNNGDAAMGRPAADQTKASETASSDVLKTLKETIRAAAIDVYQTVGPGLPASVYEECLSREFEQAALPFKRQVPIAVNYKDAQLDSGYRMNLFVADKVIVLIEGTDSVRIQSDPILDFLCAGGWTAGVVINFNATNFDVTTPKNSKSEARNSQHVQNSNV